MKRKILLVTCERMPTPGQPVTGGALRVHGLAKGLEAHGHEVLVSMPKEVLEKGASKADKALAHTPEKVADVIFDVMPDVVIIEQWGLATYLPKMDIPLAIDLHGPLSLENSFKESGNFRTDAITKIESLAKADLLIVPGRAQKQYFLTWALLGGADPKNPPFMVTPVSMDKVTAKRRAGARPRLVFGGATWPGLDPFPGLTIAAKTADKIKGAEVSLYVGAPKLAEDHPLYAINKGVHRDYRDRLKGHKSVKYHELIPHAELMKVYAGARAA
ncbi:hypothetical protein KDL45_14310, partial [bacterium]|nr:hypothetical protein [bacterium]